MLLLATMISFTACGGDEPKEYEDTSIIGTWIRQEVISSSSDYITTIIKQTQIFRTDKTCSATVEIYINDKFQRGYGYNYTYSYNGKILKLTGGESGKTSTYSAKIIGDKLSITNDDGTLTFTRQ